MFKNLYIRWLTYQKKKHHKLHLRYSERADKEMKYGESDQVCDHYLNMSDYHFKKYLKAHDRWLRVKHGIYQ